MRINSPFGKSLYRTHVKLDIADSAKMATILQEKVLLYNKANLVELINSNKLDIADIDKTIKDLRTDLYSSPKTPKYSFEAYKTSRQDVCLSSLFTHKIDEHDNPHDILLNYFPINDTESILILGYPKSSEKECGAWVRSFRKKSNKEILVEINQLLFRKCEMWACSKKLFSDKVKPIEAEVQKTMKETACNQDKYADTPVPFNIFD